MTNRNWPTHLSWLSDQTLAHPRLPVRPGTLTEEQFAVNRRIS